MTGRDERDALLSELLSLWEGPGSHLTTLPGGQRVPRSERERDLIRALREAFYAQPRRNDKPKPAGGLRKSRAKPPAKEPEPDAPTTDPEAVPA